LHCTVFLVKKSSSDEQRNHLANIFHVSIRHKKTEEERASKWRRRDENSVFFMTFPFVRAMHIFLGALLLALPNRRRTQSVVLVFLANFYELESSTWNLKFFSSKILKCHIFGAVRQRSHEIWWECESWSKKKMRREWNDNYWGSKIGS
jgi:hypothetical protein